MTFEVRDVDLGPATLDVLATGSAVLESGLGPQQFNASFETSPLGDVLLVLSCEGPLGSKKVEFKVYEALGMVDVEPLP